MWAGAQLAARRPTAQVVLALRFPLFTPGDHYGSGPTLVDWLKPGWP
jgi:hypothetical protein